VHNAGYALVGWDLPAAESPQESPLVTMRGRFDMDSPHTGFEVHIMSVTGPLPSDYRSCVAATGSEPPLPRELAGQLSGSENVAAHRSEYVGLGRPFVQSQATVKCVYRHDVSVGVTRRRAGAPISERAP
jgi:hypothetical protein